jgi:histidinol-phosphatase (PHP family)
VSDYHLHLHEHGAGTGGPPLGVYPPGHIDRYVEAALARGITEIGFTEHLYRCVESEPVFGSWWEREPDPRLAAELGAWIRIERSLSLDRYVEVVLDAKARGLPVKLGLEVDFIPGTEQGVLDLLDGIPFDYLVGSVHWIGGWNFMRDSAPAEYARRGVDVAFRQYFELERTLAASNLVDALAHVDIIERHALRPEGSLAEHYDAIVAAAESSRTAVEVSSAGLRHTVRRPYPAPDFLARFHAAGIPITLASDAHLAQDAGTGHAEVVAAARAAGYRQYNRYLARQPIVTPLPEIAA